MVEKLKRAFPLNAVSVVHFVLELVILSRALGIIGLSNLVVLSERMRFMILFLLAVLLFILSTKEKKDNDLGLGWLAAVFCVGAVLSGIVFGRIKTDAVIAAVAGIILFSYILLKKEG